MNDRADEVRSRIKPPAELQPVIDAAVAHAFGEGPEPAGIEQLHDWLNVDGWDALIADLFDEMALKIDYLASLHFDDEEMRARVGKEDDELVTDAERLDYARDFIARIRDGNDDDYFYSSVHTYPITDRKGRTAIMACTVDVLGQAGPAPSWDGVFRSRDDYLDYLKGEGYWLGSELDDLDDARILAKWHR